MPLPTRRQVANYAVYIAVRSVVCLLQAMSIETAYGIARLLARLAYLVDRRHRLVALKNITLAFGDRYTPRERERLVLAVYEHFLRVFVEFVFIPRKLHVNNWKRYFSFDCAHEVIDLFVQDRAKIIVTGHFGNWEMAGYLLAVIGLKPTSIARDLDNPYLHQFVERFRRWSGQKIVSKKGDFDQIVETLAERRALVTLADQSAGPKGLFVSFFGRPASTHKAVALLSVEHDAPIVVGYAYRDQRGFHYKIVTGKPVDPRSWGATAGAVPRITQHYTTELEQAIHQHPDQYFWLHDRWKHQPAPAKAKRAA